MKPKDILQADRPWPAPRRTWALRMNWHDLLFAHWPVPLEALQSKIPAELELDTFEGRAWIGVVPFGMREVRPRFFPRLPWISAFPELNVRTYVKMDDRPGVWFFSLDAGNPVVVRVARATFHLPYFDARMHLKRLANHVAYDSQRTHGGAPPASFEAQYRPIGPPQPAEQSSLDHWLTARYCLYASDSRDVLYRGEIHHAPWPLQPAEAKIVKSSLTDWLGIPLPDTPPLLHFSKSLDVLAWSLDCLK